MAEDSDAPEVAQVFVEAAERPIAGGRWYVRADDTVVYRRPSGEWVEPALVNAATLRDSTTWVQISSEDAEADR